MSTRTGRTRAKPVHETNGSKRTEAKPRAVTIELPLVTAEVRAPQLPKIPGQATVTGAVGTAAAGVATAARGVADVATDAAARTRKVLPSAPVLFYAGLAATAAFGAITWPVAVAIGVGTAVARGAAR